MKDQSIGEECVARNPDSMSTVRSTSGRCMVALRSWDAREIVKEQRLRVTTAEGL